MKDSNQYVEQPVLIAYAEDHELVRSCLVSCLEETGGIKVIFEAKNGLELIAFLERSSFIPDICIIDIKMPEMDGFATVTKIKKKWNAIKILVLSAYQQDEYIVQMILAGANGYLSKDCTLKELKNAILSIYEHDMYISELFSQKQIAAVQYGTVKLPDLTEKELQLLRLSIKDISYHEIAALMKTTYKSVEGYRSKIFQKLGIKTRVGMAIYAVRFGYVSI